MRSRLTVLKHPLHPLLVMFPVAFLPLLLVLDGLAWYYGADALWLAGFWIAMAGLVMTVLAVLSGVLDLSAIPDGSRAHRVAVFHFVVGMVILAVYAAAVWVRWPVESVPRAGLATGIDLVGTLVVTLQGWLGAELVYAHHIGVYAPEEGGDPTPLQPGPGLHVPPRRKTRGGQRFG